MLPRGLLKEYFQWLTLSVRMLDTLCMVSAGWLGYYVKFKNGCLPERYLVALSISIPLVILIFNAFKIYESVRTKDFSRHILQIGQALTAVMILLAGLAFFTKTGETFSRAWFGWWGIIALFLLVLFRGMLLIILRWMRMQGLNERCVVIIGAGTLGKRLIRSVHQRLWTGFRIIKVFDDFPVQPLIGGISVEKTPTDLNHFILRHKNKIDEIWIALPLHAAARVKEIVHALRHHTVAVRYVLDLLGLELVKHSLTAVDGIPMVNLNASPMVGLNRLIKAIEDRFIALAILILISPLFLLLMLAVKCSSKGPIFFKQIRHGWDGKLIKIYKFRTMYVHQEDNATLTQATPQDARVTPLGRFLRKTSLDELPQFVNVLQGRMSIVGPRPHAVVHNEFYKDSISAYMQRHQVKPGITGWAQVNGWRGETNTLEKMKKRIEYDLFYIENWSLIFDLKIIILTFFQGFINKNAY